MGTNEGGWGAVGTTNRNEWARMTVARGVVGTTNRHKWTRMMVARGVGLNHESTQMDTNDGGTGGGFEPRIDTNGHE